MNWHSWLEAASHQSVWTWVVLIIFGSTCFDIAIQAKGSVAKQAIEKLSKPRKAEKTHWCPQLGKQDETIKHPSIEHLAAYSYGNSHVFHLPWYTHLTHWQPCALAWERQTQTEEEEWMQWDQESVAAHESINWINSKKLPCLKSQKKNRAKIQKRHSSQLWDIHQCSKQAFEKKQSRLRLASNNHHEEAMRGPAKAFDTTARLIWAKLWVLNTDS